MRFLIISILCFTALFAGAQNFQEAYTIGSPFPSVDPMISRLDSLTAKIFKRESSISLQDPENVDYAPYDPGYSVAQLKDRLGKVATEIPMSYTKETENYISYFTQKRKPYLSKMLGYGEIYFPMFEEVMDRNGIPFELKYLPIIESGFQPDAVSHTGATGIWQIMYKTARYLGLDMNTYVDERMDPVKATEAAAAYLKKMYNLYDDWLLALAAYNAGPGNVNKAIAAAGGIKNFWAIRPYLPKETQNYVPSFIAVTYCMTYYNDYHIKATKPPMNILAMDTLIIKDKVSLKYIAELTGVDEEYLKQINPSLKLGKIPATENGTVIRFPLNKLAVFQSKRSYLAYDPYLVEYEVPKTQTIVETKKYKVKKGDNLSQIASRNGVSVGDIKKWNKLSGNSIKVGQLLVVKKVSKVIVDDSFTDDSEMADVTIINPEDDVPVSQEVVETNENDNADAVSRLLNMDNPANSSGKLRFITHTVQTGDTLWQICQLYPGANVERIKADNNLTGNEIKPGMTLKITL